MPRLNAVRAIVRRPLRRLRRALPADRSLTALEPLSRVWGLDRGTPIDQHYLSQFFAANARDIRGAVLETGDRRYTARYGQGVTRSDVLHYGGHNPVATLYGDLVTGEGVPEGAFDCFILVNTLVVIYEVERAIATAFAALRPGGVLLVHFTGITASPLDDFGPAGWSGEGDLWRFTSGSARRLLEKRFPASSITVSVYGNVRSAAAFLYGLAAEELSREELAFADPRYEVVIAVRAVRPS